MLGIEGQSRPFVEAILSRAAEHKRAVVSGQVQPTLAGHVVANLFFEDSTRTRSSFEIASKRLGAEVLNWTVKGSSVSKGESLLDTARNIDAMGPAVIVMRHNAAGAPQLVAQRVRAAVVNAGDGAHEHPSQALLDAFTLKERLGPLEGKEVLIVGDVLHSRVARSNAHCLTLLGVRVRLCGPPTLLPKAGWISGCEVSSDLDASLERAHAVMMLRLQLERQGQSLFPSPREYARLYGLSSQRAKRLAPEIPILHPGPMNRGVEISSEVADSLSSVILEQVTNGVYVRMAILEACL